MDVWIYLYICMFNGCGYLNGKYQNDKTTMMSNTNNNNKIVMSTKMSMPALSFADTRSTVGDGTMDGTIAHTHTWLTHTEKTRLSGGLPSFNHSYLLFLACACSRHRHHHHRHHHYHHNVQIFFCLLKCPFVIIIIIVVDVHIVFLKCQSR